MSELIKRLEDGLAAAEEVQAENEDESFARGMVSGFNAALKIAKELAQQF